MKPLQGVVLYKRHSRTCLISKLDIPGRDKRYQMDCECVVWVTGRTPDGQPIARQSTGQTTCELAERVVNAKLARLAATSEPHEDHGFTVAQCIEKFIESRSQAVGERTIGQFRVALGRLQTYLERQGIRYMLDVKADHLESFKTAGLPREMKSTTRSQTDNKIRTFLKAAYRREWTKELLTAKTDAVRAVYEQKDPYDDDEVTAILDEALELDGGTRGYAAKPKTFRLLLELMLETGMRVGDAVLFDPGKLVRSEVSWVYTFTPQKQKRNERLKTTDAYIPAELKTRIDECDWLSPNGPFMYGSTHNAARRLGQAVYERMQSIGKRKEIADCRPHRLRDTFAVRKLLSGVPLEDVSRALGHASVTTTETYYAKWVPARKLKLERTLAGAIVNGGSNALRDADHHASSPAKLP